MIKARLTVWESSACQVVHEATLEVLARTGVEVREHASLDLLGRAGAKVDGTRVRLPARLVEEALDSAPRRWTLKSRGDHDDLELRNGPTYFGSGSDCIYIQDPKTGKRRRTTCADIENLAAVSNQLDSLDYVMSLGLPSDVPQEIDDLAQMAAMLRGTSKPILICPRTADAVPIMHEMATVCGEAESFAIYGMPAPPLSHDEDGLGKLRQAAHMRIPTVYASAPSCGSTGPCSITGTVVVSNAEVLSGLVIHQLASPGAPFIYGCGADAMNMRTMLPAYCVPESLLGLQAMTDLARHYDMPSFSYAGMSDSKLPDMQFAAEIAMTLYTGGLSRATMLHDIGYMETGMRSSYESLVLADELVSHVRAFMGELRVDADALALDEIHEVGPGGNYLARNRTRRHCRAFWQPKLFDHLVFDRWVAQGARDLGSRLSEKVMTLVDAPRQFVPDQGASEALDGILARGRGH